MEISYSIAKVRSRPLALKSNHLARNEEVFIRPLAPKNSLEKLPLLECIAERL